MLIIQYNLKEVHITLKEFPDLTLKDLIKKASARLGLPTKLDVDRIACMRDGHLVDLDAIPSEGVIQVTYQHNVKG